MSISPVLTHKFVESIPDVLEAGTLYVSIRFKSVIHTCCCGFGNQVVTPLSPSDWKLTFDGRSITLYPSIGNWNFSCQSHYWIKSNRVEWASSWPQEDKNVEPHIVPFSHRYNNKQCKTNETKFGFWKTLLQKIRLI